MGISKLNQIIIFFVFISFAAAQEVKVGVLDNENKLKLECENDAIISLVLNSNQSIWSDSFDINCPNPSSWENFGIGLVIVVHCHEKQNCSVDFSNITMTNCTDYRKYLNVKYTCNTTQTTTEITTTVKSEPDDDDDDDDSEEDKSTTSTTTTKKPPAPLKPAYLPLPVPALLPTLKPTQRPYYYPQPRLPPIREPLPLFRHYNGGGYNFQPPMILPLPLPAPVPIPIFG